MVEADEPRLVGLQAPHQPLDLLTIGAAMLGMPVGGRLAGFRELDPDDVCIGVGEHPHRRPSGDDGKVGGKARTAGETAEHRRVLFQDLDEDLGDHVVPVGRGECQSALAAGAVDDMMKKPREPLDEAIPGVRSPPQAVLHKRGIVGAPWPAGRSVGTRSAHGDASRRPACPGLTPPPIIRRPFPPSNRSPSRLTEQTRKSRFVSLTGFVVRPTIPRSRPAFPPHFHLLEMTPS